MKSSSNSPQSDGTAWKSKVIPIITVICALGVGITGTLLWVQSRPTASSTPTPNVTVTATPNGVPPMLSNVPVPMPAVPPVDATHPPTDPTKQEPPKTLTTGMTAPQASLTLANWYYDHDQWHKAISNYQRAIAGGFDNPDVRTDLGNSLRFIDEPRQALDQYRIAQRQDPSHEQSLFNQGGLWAFSLNDSKQAVVAWQTYLKRFPHGQSAEAAKKFIAEHK